MTNLKNWWHSKSQHKKGNWLMLALAIAFIAGCTVEALTYWALIGALPGAGLVWLEGSRIIDAAMQS